MTYVYLYLTHAEAKRSFERKLKELTDNMEHELRAQFERMEIRTGGNVYRYIVVPISIGIENIMDLECVCDPTRVIEVLQQTIKQIQAEAQLMYIRARHIEELQGGKTP